MVSRDIDVKESVSASLWRFICEHDKFVGGSAYSLAWLRFSPDTNCNVEFARVFRSHPDTAFEKYGPISLGFAVDLPFWTVVVPKAATVSG
jgi:hypothetical protein